MASFQHAVQGPEAQGSREVLEGGLSSRRRRRRSK